MGLQTVLNLGRVDRKNEPLFLGAPLGLQRYDDPKYPEFLKLWRQQKAFDWTPEEQGIENDRGQYKNLTPTEKFIFDTNLRFQTMGDSILSRSINSISEYVSQPELEICMAKWSEMETNHSYSYSYILNNVLDNPTEFFDSILEDKEIVQRANAITKSYNDLLGKDKNIKDKIFKAVLSTQVTEGVHFYTSFVCSFWFGNRGVMTGNADIIGLIARDENLHRAITANIMEIWRDVKSEGFQEIMKDNEQLIYDMYGQAANAEKEWASYLFSEGSLLGLNETILSQYAEWLVDVRLRSLGYNPLYGHHKTNPLGTWADKYFDSSKKQEEPQNTKITGYKVGARTSDLDNESFEDFAL